MTLIGLVEGRFRIEQRCASGGMGSVYRARDLSTGARVALKVNSDPSSMKIRQGRSGGALKGISISILPVVPRICIRW